MGLVTARPGCAVSTWYRPDAGRHYRSDPKRWKQLCAGAQRRPIPDLCARSRRVR
ncbi:hypothetical protein OH687_32645 [Burkholderia anthina]|nr:hypothetical protein OH687_32645 [Burkholderia anthina]